MGPRPVAGLPDFPLGSGLGRRRTADAAHPRGGVKGARRILDEEWRSRSPGSESMARRLLCRPARLQARPAGPAATRRRVVERYASFPADAVDPRLAARNRRAVVSHPLSITGEP